MTGNVVEEWIRSTGNQGFLRPQDCKELGDGTILAIKPLLFHWSMIRCDLHDVIGYRDRWCYATEGLARAALDACPLSPPPDWEPEGWHRHPKTMRRRPGGDPSFEYIEA